MLTISPHGCHKEHLNKHTTISLISQWSMYPPPSWSKAMKIQFSLSSFVSRTVTETAWNCYKNGFKCRLKFMIHLKILKEVESATIVFIKHSKQRFCHQRILTRMHHLNPNFLSKLPCSLETDPWLFLPQENHSWTHHISSKPPPATSHTFHSESSQSLCQENANQKYNFTWGKQYFTLAPVVHSVSPWF